ncbi:hypothetical protein TNCV_1993151 [Trichonephila clavipes]|nr:hypothetical protein TNCV_1993151 [Trichonephila clavipes]
MSLALVFSAVQGIVRFDSLPPIFEEYPGDGEGLPTFLLLSPTSRVSSCREGIIHLRKSMSSLGFESRPKKQQG